MMVPMRREHSNYNNLPSRSNIFRAKNGWIIPCAKCKYAKSCFEESGVAECPSGYHKMYTGYLHAGHQGHHGNNNRICVDKNPRDNDCKFESVWLIDLVWPYETPVLSLLFLNSALAFPR